MYSPSLREWADLGEPHRGLGLTLPIPGTRITRQAAWNGAMRGYKRYLYPPHHFAKVHLDVQLIQIPLPLWVCFLLGE